MHFCIRTHRHYQPFSASWQFITWIRTAFWETILWRSVPPPIQQAANGMSRDLTAYLQLARGYVYVFTLSFTSKYCVQNWEHGKCIMYISSPETFYQTNCSWFMYNSNTLLNIYRLGKSVSIDNGEKLMRYLGCLYEWVSFKFSQSLLVFRSCFTCYFKTDIVHCFYKLIFNGRFSQQFKMAELGVNEKGKSRTERPCTFGFSPWIVGVR